MTNLEINTLEKDWEIYCKNAGVESDCKPYSDYTLEQKKSFLEELQKVALNYNKSIAKHIVGTSYEISVVPSKKIQITLSSWAVELLDGAKDKYGFSRSKAIETLIAKYFTTEFGDVSN